MNYLLCILLVLMLAFKTQAQDSMRYAKPVFTSDAPSSVKLNEWYRYRFTAMDSAGLPIAYTVKDLPAWLHFNVKTNTVTGKAIKAGQYPVHATVSNGHFIAQQNLMLTVCDKKTTNILCLGNSLTNGTNKYNSYRRDLWQMLHAANYNFDLIGSWNKHHGGADMPNDDFDTDHDGHSGWTFDNMFHPPDWDSVRGNINQWLTRYKTDIVLIELGTNDVFQCVKIADMISKLDQLVRVLREKNNTVKIFVAQIPPLGEQWAPKKLCGTDIPYRDVIIDLNKQIATYSERASNKVSPITAVDQYTGVNPATDMYDDIHPNDKGEKTMAKRWFDAIKIYLNKLP